MLVSKKEKRETKEKMKRNAEHSATTTKFVLEKGATNHFEKRRELEKKELRKKETKGKKEKKRTRRKKAKKQKNLVDPASSHMLVSKRRKRLFVPRLIRRCFQQVLFGSSRLSASVLLSSAPTGARLNAAEQSSSRARLRCERGEAKSASVFEFSALSATFPAM